MEARVDAADAVLHLLPSSTAHRRLRHRRPLLVHVVARGLQDAGAARRGRIPAAAALPPGGAHLRRPLHFLGREVRVPAALAGPGGDAPCAELAVGGSGVGGIAAGDGLLSALVPVSVAQAMEG